LEGRKRGSWKREKTQGKARDQRRVSNAFPARDAQTHLEREEEREPAEHLWADEMHSIWVDRKSNVSVEMSLEVSADMREKRDSKVSLIELKKASKNGKRLEGRRTRVHEELQREEYGRSS